MDNLRILSFNVNGLRSIIKEGNSDGKDKLYTFLSRLPNSPNIVCIQETKIGSSAGLDLEMAAPKGWAAYYAFHRPSDMLDPSRARLGYSGVATFVKRDLIPVVAYEDGFVGHGSNTCVPIGPSLTVDDFVDDDYDTNISINTNTNINTNININTNNNIKTKLVTMKHLNAEGRVMITDHVSFVLFNCYFPNDNTPTEERRVFREKFHKCIFKRASLILNRKVIIVGDVNVTYHPQDHYKWATTTSDITSFLEADLIRKFFYERLLTGEWKDAFREVNPHTPAQFTCWDQRLNLRPSNQGSRIDLFLLRGDFRIISCQHLTDFYGSDHCPIFLELASLLTTTTLLSPSPPSPPTQVEDQSTKSIKSQRRIDHFFKMKKKSLL